MTSQGVLFGNRVATGDSGSVKGVVVRPEQGRTNPLKGKDSAEMAVS